MCLQSLSVPPTTTDAVILSPLVQLEIFNMDYKLCINVDRRNYNILISIYQNNIIDKINRIFEYSVVSNILDKYLDNLERQELTDFCLPHAGRDELSRGHQAILILVHLCEC